MRFTVGEPLGHPDACHCRQCRKTSGHYWASVDVRRESIVVAGEVRWFQSSERVRRGFCGTCGSSLFWDAAGRERMAVAMGAFDGPTGTHLGMHIFVADKGDYYDIADGLPQRAG